MTAGMEAYIRERERVLVYLTTHVYVVMISISRERERQTLRLLSFLMHRGSTTAALPCAQIELDHLIARKEEMRCS
jgi:hypothetical protein